MDEPGYRPPPPRAPRNYAIGLLPSQINILERSHNPVTCCDSEGVTDLEIARRNYAIARRSPLEEVVRWVATSTIIRQYEALIVKEVMALAEIVPSGSRSEFYQYLPQQLCINAFENALRVWAALRSQGKYCPPEAIQAAEQDLDEARFALSDVTRGCDGCPPVK